MAAIPRILVVYDGDASAWRSWSISGWTPATGRVPNANLAEYAVPVHADAPPLMDAIVVGSTIRT
jgi:CO/xanthine dehydrogenase Mo-binding subunit